jgi:hypothetical protein
MLIPLTEVSIDSVQVLDAGGNGNDWILTPYFHIPFWCKALVALKNWIHSSNLHHPASTFHNGASCACGLKIWTHKCNLHHPASTFHFDASCACGLKNWTHTCNLHHPTSTFHTGASCACGIKQLISHKPTASPYFHTPYWCTHHIDAHHPTYTHQSLWH